MSWDLVDKKHSSGGTRFLKIEDGETVVVRALDDEPYVNYVHKISQKVKGQDVFRSIPATPNLDDDYIQNATNRYPAVPQFNLRVFVYGPDKDDPVGSGEIKILAGGVQIFKPLKTMHEQFGTICDFDITIKREGSERETQYIVNSRPRPLVPSLDFDELIEALDQDATLAWENLFAPISAEDQKRELVDAGFDINYDPAAEIAANMDYDEATKITMPFGKYKDKTMGELLVIDAGYVEWVASNVTTNDAVAAAARVLIDNMAQAAPARQVAAKSAKKIEAPKAAPKAAAKKVAPKAAAKKAEPETPRDDGANRDSLIQDINKVFSSEDRFQDAMEIVSAIQEAGGGKTRIRDLTVVQLQTLLDNIS